MQSLIERMWLAALLLVLAAFQTYLFSAVIRCSIYVSGIEASRRRRESAFERCSERVRLAKENGLWRTTSWGGGFQQYKGQYDENKPKKTVKQKGFHVQWNIQKNELPEEEQVIKPSVNRGQMMLTPSQPIEQTSSQQSIRKSDPAEHISSHKVCRTHSHRKGQSESPKKERIPPQYTAQKSSSESSHMISHRNEETQQTEGSTSLIKATEGRVTLKIDRRESTHTTSASSSHRRQTEKQRDKVDGDKRLKEQEHEQNEQSPLNSSINRHKRSASRRPSLHTHKSVDSEDVPAEQKISLQKDKCSTSQQRRRSSFGCDNSPSGNQQTSRHQKSALRTTERRQYETPVVKKVSITATHQ
uniref:DUF4005 domain-containing protein n=1 Tax=Heterorhabditis bacteriophora TaxID=37862 RepID=A0A1I7XLG0_HETBA